jgi:iron complex transport system substrate-binding protein
MSRPDSSWTVTAEDGSETMGAAWPGSHCPARAGAPRIDRRRAAAGLVGLVSALAGHRLASAAQHATPIGTAPLRFVAHRYGQTEVAGLPQRVVTVGLTDQDYAVALGVAPVGVREWFGGHPGALWPWAWELLGDEPLPAVLPVDALNFEQIAALAPPTWSSSPPPTRRFRPTSSRESPRR